MNRDRMANMAGIAAKSLGLRPTDMLAWVCLHGCLAAVWEGGEGYWADGARLAGRLAGLEPP
jgi:streptomycin 6-kinase